MSDVVIKVEGLSKFYRYDQSGFNRASLRDACTDEFCRSTLPDAARSPVQGARNAAP